MSEEREQVRVSLYADSYDSFPINMTLPEMLAWVGELLAQVPEQFRDESAFEVEHEYGSYDESGHTTVRVYYDRPITDAEIAQRAADAEAYRRQCIAEVEARERATFEALKAKYG